MSTKKIILLDEVDKTELQTDINNKASIGHKHSPNDITGSLPVSKGGLGMSKLNVNQVLYTSAKDTVSQLDTPKEPSVLVQGTRTIHNLLGRTGNFDDSDVLGIYSIAIIDQTHVKYGSYSLKLVGKTSSAEVTYTLRPKNEDSIFHLDPSHIYYIRVETYQETKLGDIDIYWPIEEPSFLNGQSGPAGQWNLISAVNNRSSFSEGYYPLRLDFNNNSIDGNMWFDGLMLIDLTADFGAGNEPDKTWCDTNLPYFSNKYNIKYDTPYWKPLNDIGTKSVVTLLGRENTIFTVSFQDKVVASGQIGPNGTSVIELKETGDYAIHAESNGNVYNTTLTINYTGTYEVEIYTYDPFSKVSTAYITSITKKGVAPSVWAIGDARLVNVDMWTTSTPIYAFIVAFDHNADVEMNGEHHVLCSIGKSAATNGKDICLVEDNSGYSYRMNSSAKNSGGWASSSMRSSLIPEFLNDFDAGIQYLMRTRTIYTDNTGGGSNTSSYVTATTDRLYLPSEFEIFGTRAHANSAEQNYQKQLEYYKNGASKVRYAHNNTSKANVWMLRSPYIGSSTSFCCTSTSGAVSSYNANTAGGFAPLFTL